jgi:hypothetical protein
MAIYIIRGFLHPRKNARICYQRAMLPIQAGVTALADSNVSLGPFLFEFKLSGLYLTIMARQKVITICRRLSHPTRSLSRIVCRGQERPNSRKATFRPDFQPLLYHEFFIKANVTTRYRKTVKSRYS